MASRVPYPKRGFIEFKCSMLFPFRKIAIASKKYQPVGKHASRAVRNSVTSLTINTNLIINYKYKGSAQKTREAPLVFQVWGSVWCLPSTPNPKLCSTSRPVKLPGCAGHCTLAFATVWMGITSRFDLWALACVRNWHGFASNSYRIMECQKSAAPH